MHSVSPVHIRVRSQVKNPMIATNFEDLADKKKKVQIGPSTIINEPKKTKIVRLSKKNSIKLSSPKRKPAFQWSTPKKNKKCDLMKVCRLSDYTSPIRIDNKTPPCDICVDSRTRSVSRSRSPDRNRNCSFLKRLSSSASPVSLNRSLEFDPNTTFTVPNRSKSHESYLKSRDDEILPIDENELILKKEFLIKKLIDSESFSSDILKLLDLMKDYFSSSNTGLDLKSMLNYLKKDISSLNQLIDLYHLTNKDLRGIINEFLNPSTLGMLRRVKQNESILKKIECLKQENAKFKKLIAEYENNICLTGSTNEALNIENNVLSNLKQSLEDNRAHLRRQLIAREAECNRFGVQIRNLNRQLDRAKMEIELLRESREKAGLSKLKFPQQTNSNLNLSQKPLNQKSSSMSNLSKSIKLDKTHFTFEEIMNDPLKTRLYVEKLNSKIKEKDLCIKNLNEIIIQSKHESKQELNEMANANVEGITSRERKSASTERGDKTHISKLMKENESLKLNLKVKEDRLKNALKMVDQKKNELKKSNSQKTVLTNSTSSEDASSSIQKSRSESPKKLSHNNNESTIQREKNFSEIELNNVRSRLQQRLNELEPLPELLKNTELKLHDALGKLKQYEHEITENRKCINDLKSKLEMAFNKLKNRGIDKNELHELQKNLLLTTSLTSLQQQQMELSAKQHKEIETMTLNKMEPIERRIQNLEDENRELIRQLGHKDDLIRDITNKLTVKSNEASSYSRQLDLALSDSNLREHQIKEKFVTKERNLMSRLNELESKLRSMELHSSVDRRDKDELCQDYISQIRDLKSKLEQTQQTNRQMQEYVNFLKNSYMQYFNDSTLHTFDTTTSTSGNFLSGTSSNTFF